MPERRRKYSSEYRDEAVMLAIEASRPIAVVARELNINEGTLGNWVAKYRAEHAGAFPDWRSAACLRRLIRHGPRLRAVRIRMAE